MGVALSLAGVGFRYGSDWVVRDVSFDVAAGEAVALLGPSGCGKTTLLNLVCGVLSPAAGRINLGTRDITDVPVHCRHIGVVFQGYALFPHLCVFDNVAFPLRTAAHRMPADQARRQVAETLALVGLTGMERRKPAELSGGQQQRVALARALVFRPDLLLLDEPLAALDHGLREQLQDELRRLHELLGTTIVYVTHDRAEAMTVADRVAVMQGGGIVQAGRPADLYAAPRTPYVARLLGGANFLPGPFTTIAGVSGVLFDGRVYTETGSLDYEPGEPVALMVRPEAIGLGPPPAGAVATARGTIVRKTYLGNQFRLRIKLASGVEWLVYCPHDKHDPAAPGAEVALWWREADSRLLPDPPSARPASAR